MINDVYADDVGSNRRVAKALSATLQAVVAGEMGADQAAAFMTEYRSVLESAQAVSLLGVFTAYEELFIDLSSALYSLTRYTALKLDEDPKVMLGAIIRTYRKAPE